MLYLMHTTPVATPLASPRAGPSPAPSTLRDVDVAAAYAAGDDLEAPLLQNTAAAPRHHAAHNHHHHHHQQQHDGGYLKAAMFGMINVAAGVPALIAFCAVVFKVPRPAAAAAAEPRRCYRCVLTSPASPTRCCSPSLHTRPPPTTTTFALPQAPLYAPYLDPLCKLFFLSSATHQVVASWRSAVPNAVGQVQDVGLIFLSAMATSIAAACTRAGLSAEAALGTALFTMAASTCLVGLSLVAVARLRAAAFVQYLPLPAVGGYLAYVGYFCVASGLGLGCGVQLGSLSSWALMWDAQVRFGRSGSRGS